MTQVTITCPKCRAKDILNLSSFMLWELHSSGCINIALYHSDHVLYVNMDGYNVRKISVCDPTSILAYGLNMYVDGYLILRQPLIPIDKDLIFVDMNKKVVDARLILNYMYAVLLTRYLRLNGRTIQDRDIIDVRGVNFAVVRNNGMLLAKRVSGDEEKAINLLIDMQKIVDSVPVNLEVLKHIY
ncbi:MAG: hypothetical protein NDP13_06060 [Crenarchaeota archaeon]|nr:hypothetical protein [Thermoproteota archaeon]MCR8454531.1 hypothetical protein [Thermoproteota archaeon]MCR8455005.1 hypothetical protein [Thermoproteota archaeon]MCR8463607.1 hypothetical protein [Thermoproteota archaeon]MCR8470453.1 hypothetical protein [Thermoproteota archaeon]